MRKPTFAWCNAKRVQGLGLIEIMIALALGAIIMLGITEVATQNSITRYELERTGRQIESAAYALRQIENDINSSAFWGEVGDNPRWSPTMPSLPALAATGLPPVCAGMNTDADDAAGELWYTVGFPVQGQEATVGGSAECLSDVKAGSGFLAVRRASSCALEAVATNCDPQGNDFHVQVNACFDPTDGTRLPGDLYIAPGNALSALSGETRECDGTLAPRYRVLSRVYYVRSDPGNPDCEPDPSAVEECDQLMRVQLSGSTYGDPVALVEGVELLRFEYGLDNVGDGQVDEIISTPLGAAWSDVVMVRIQMIVRNLQASAGYEDDRVYRLAGSTYCVAEADGGSDCDVTIPDSLKNHRRQLYTRTVSLRNVAGRREEQ